MRSRTLAGAELVDSVINNLEKGEYKMEKNSDGKEVKLKILEEKVFVSIMSQLKEIKKKMKETENTLEEYERVKQNLFRMERSRKSFYELSRYGKYNPQKQKEKIYPYNRMESHVRNSQPVQYKIRNVFREQQSLLSVFKQYLDFLAPGFKYDSSALSKSFSSILEEAKKTVSSKIKQISQQLKTIPRNVNLNSFIELVQEYRNKSVKCRAQETSTDSKNDELVQKSKQTLEYNKIKENSLLLTKQLQKMKDTLKSILQEIGEAAQTEHDKNKIIKEIQSIKTQNSRLKSKLSKIRVNLSKTKKETNQLKQKLSLIKQQTSMETKRSFNVLQELYKQKMTLLMTEKIKQIKMERSNSEQKEARMKAQIDELCLNIQELKLQKEAINFRNAEQVAVLKHRIGQFQQKNKYLASDKTKYAQIIKVLKARVDSNPSKSAEQEKLFQKMKDELQETQSECEILKLQKLKFKKQIEAFSIKQSQSLKRIEELQKVERQSEMELKQKDKKLLEAQSRIASEKDTKEKFKQDKEFQIQTLMDVIEELKATLQINTQRNQKEIDLAEDISSFTSQKEKFQQVKAQLQSENKELVARKIQLQIKIDNLESQHKELMQKVEKNNKQMMKIPLLVEHPYQKLLKKCGSPREKVIKKQEVRLTKFQTPVISLTSSGDAKIVELSEKLNRMEELKVDILDLEDKKEQLHGEIKVLQLRIENLMKMEARKRQRLV